MLSPPLLWPSSSLTLLFTSLSHSSSLPHSPSLSEASSPGMRIACCRLDWTMITAPFAWCTVDTKSVDQPSQAIFAFDAQPNPCYASWLQSSHSFQVSIPSLGKSVSQDMKRLNYTASENPSPIRQLLQAISTQLVCRSILALSRLLRGLKYTCVLLSALSQLLTMSAAAAHHTWKPHQGCNPELERHARCTFL